MRDQCRAGLRAGSGHDVQHAPWQPALFDREPRQLEQRGRGEFRGLRDHRVAGRERGRDGAPRLVERRVPRKDHADDAERLAAGVGVIARAEIDRLAVDRVHQAAVELEVLRSDLDLEGHLDGGFSRLAALELRELTAPLAALARDVAPDAAPLDRPALAPLGACAAAARRGGVAARATGALLAGGGSVAVERAAAPGWNLVALDELIPAR